MVFFLDWVHSASENVQEVLFLKIFFCHFAKDNVKGVLIFERKDRALRIAMPHQYLDGIPDDKVIHIRLYVILIGVKPFQSLLIRREISIRRGLDNFEDFLT